MRHRTRPESGDDDVDALAAVWGREASATAAPHDRPTIAPADPPGRGDGRRRLLVIATGVVAVAVITAAVAVVLGGGDDDRPAAPSTTGATTTTTAPAWDPSWATAVTCPRLEVTAERRTTVCPLALDDERAYVVTDGDEGPRLLALGAADGAEVWATPFPDGALAVFRYPSTVVVLGQDRFHAVDPVTGAVRWSAVGLPVAPLGRDHLLVESHSTDDTGTAITTMAVVEAATGAVVLTQWGWAPSFTIHPCDAAGLVLVSRPEGLTAHGIADGAERWSVDAPYGDQPHPYGCSAQVVVSVDGDGRLESRDVRTGLPITTSEVAAASDGGLATILDVVGTTVVVRSEGVLEGYVADPSLAPTWRLAMPSGGRQAVVATGGGGVAVAAAGGRAGWFSADGSAGPQIPLEGWDEVVVDAARLIAWNAEEALVAPVADLDRSRILPLGDVRRAAATSTHVVVTTRAEVRLYPFDP